MGCISASEVRGSLNPSGHSEAKCAAKYGNYPFFALFKIKTLGGKSTGTFK